MSECERRVRGLAPACALLLAVVLGGGCGGGGGAANTAPTASFTVTPATGYRGTAIGFDASGCTDPEDAGGVLQVRWDWENDGTYDTVWSVTKAAAHTYTTAGTWTVQMQVRDSGGLTATATRTVTVAEDTEDVTIIIN